VRTTAQLAATGVVRIWRSEGRDVPVAVEVEAGRRGCVKRLSFVNVSLSGEGIYRMRGQATSGLFLNYPLRTTSDVP
jgi:hypothetical protein